MYLMPQRLFDGGEAAALAWVHLTTLCLLIDF